MTRRPFDPGELGAPPVPDPSVADLERYLAASAMEAPRGFADRVMAALETAEPPHRGLRAWLAPATRSPGPRRLVRAGALAATLVLAVTGALFAGQLADLLRNVGSGTPAPTPTVEPTPTPVPSLTTSPEITSPISPTPNPDGGETQEPSETPEPSGHESHEPESEQENETRSPRPSTPPAQPTPTPTSSG